jgi:hypothetical protein
MEYLHFLPFHIKIKEGKSYIEEKIKLLQKE